MPLCKIAKIFTPRTKKSERKNLKIFQERSVTLEKGIDLFMKEKKELMNCRALSLTILLIKKTFT